MQSQWCSLRCRGVMVMSWCSVKRLFPEYGPHCFWDERSSLRSPPFATEGVGIPAGSSLSEGLVLGNVRTQWGVIYTRAKELLSCCFPSPLSSCPSLLFLPCENHNVLITSALLEFPVCLTHLPASCTLPPVLFPVS